MKKVRTHLEKDPVLKKVIATYGELESIPVTADLYTDIVSCIVGQQLSTKAADTIWKRFESLFPEKNITPERVLALSDQEIRNVGSSFSKIKYMKGLSQMLLDHSLDLDAVMNLNDEEVIAELTKVKGIGKWTAEMILIFSLGREDTFSLGDLGLRTAVARLYNVDRDNLTEIQKITEKWQPYRSYASRYLWKSLDNEPR